MANGGELTHLYLRQVYKVPDTKRNTHPITDDVFLVWCQEQNRILRTWKAILPHNSFIIRHLPGHNPESFPLPAGKIWLNLSCSSVLPISAPFRAPSQDSSFSSSSHCATMTE